MSIPNPLISEAFTFGDITIVPMRSRVDSRRNVSLDTKISRTITLKAPIISSYMDTVTETDMAIEMARLGCIGILHRFCSIEYEVEMVKTVKRKEDPVIKDPYSIRPDAPLREIRVTMRETGVHALIVVDGENHFLGIVKYKNLLLETDATKTAQDLMVPASRLLTAGPKTANDEAWDIFKRDGIQKLLTLVDEKNVVKGLITFRNVVNRLNPRASRDAHGRLAVAAGVGITGDYLDRAIALHEAGADLLVVNVAHAHLEKCLNAVREIKRRIPECDLLAGTIATGEGAEDLFRAGADGVLVGVGNGSICRTRNVTGLGVPQVTALLTAFRAGRKWKRPIINDGGIGDSGDLAKAIAAGSSAAILGNLLAGTDKSPSEKEFINGMQVKRHRGMASLDAKAKLLRSEGMLDEDIETETASYASEGVEEGYVPYRGTTEEVVNALKNALRSTLSYCNAHTIPELHEHLAKGRLRFVRNTEAGKREGDPHHLAFGQW